MTTNIKSKVKAAIIIYEVLENKVHLWKQHIYEFNERQNPDLNTNILIEDSCTTFTFRYM